MSLSRLFPLFAVFIFLSGCAHWNRFAINHSVPSIQPAKNTHTIAVAAVDNRQLLRDGDIKPNYVGMMRAGFNIPGSIHIKHGLSLADNFAEAVATGLTSAHYRADFVSNPTPLSRSAALLALQSTPADRFLLLTIDLFESETLIRTELHYDIRAEVLDRTGRVLATSQVSGTPMLSWNALPGGIQTEARRQVIKTTAKLLTDLLNTPTIRQQL